jgi:prepilin-type N-terminal cleavage/methylation domain-containing protein
VDNLLRFVSRQAATRSTSRGAKLDSAKSLRRGFTLIEIVVVLALGALILTVVLLGVNWAQQSARDSERKNAVGQVQQAMEIWATSHGNVYTDPSTGNIVNVTALYGPLSGTRCGGSGVFQYLDCSVVVPGLGTLYIPPSGTTNPFQDGKFDMISITDRTGGSSGTNGYCIRISLEGLPHSVSAGGQAFGASDKFKGGHTMSDSGPCT